MFSLPTRHIMVVAHRGCWKNAPENSLAAIQSCIAMGVDMVEIDVRTSKDGELVLVHDASLERTTERPGIVSNMTGLELRNTRLREGAGGEQSNLTNSTIPTLRDALYLSRGEILLNLDLKAAAFDQVVSLVDELEMTDQVLFKQVVQVVQGFEKTAATAMISSGINFMPILREQDSTDKLSERLEHYAPTTPIAVEVVFNSSGYLRSARDWFTENEARLWANTMHKRYSAGLADSAAIESPGAVWGSLVADGVTILQTDEPAHAIEYLDGTGRRCGGAGGS